MIEKPKALELADYYDNFDSSVYSTPAKANAVILCLLQEAAEELRRLHEVNVELRDALKMVIDSPFREETQSHQRLVELAKTAIAKAEGGAV